MFCRSTGVKWNSDDGVSEPCGVRGGQWGVEGSPAIRAVVPDERVLVRLEPAGPDGRTGASPLERTERYVQVEYQRGEYFGSVGSCAGINVR